MGLHDRLTDRAVDMGKSSADFAVAAQRKANAFWVYAAIAAAVWWLVSWKWALVPGAAAAWAAMSSVSASLIQTRIKRYENEGDKLLKRLAGEG